MGFLDDLVGGITHGIGQAVHWGEGEVQHLVGGQNQTPPPPSPQQQQAIGTINRDTGFNGGNPGAMGAPMLQAPQIQSIKIAAPPPATPQANQPQQPTDVAGMIQKALSGANDIVARTIPAVGAAEGIGKFAMDNADKIPVNHGADVANEYIDENVHNPILNMGAKFLATPADIGQAILNTPHDVAKLGQVVTQTKSNPLPYAGDVAMDAINIASILPIGKGADIALQDAPLATRMVQGALTGAKYGAGYGAAQGVASTMQQPGSTAKDYLVNAGTGAVENAALGGLLGGVTPAGVDAVKGIRGLDERGSVQLPGGGGAPKDEYMNLHQQNQDILSKAEADETGKLKLNPIDKATVQANTNRMNDLATQIPELQTTKPEDLRGVGEQLGRTRASMKQLDAQIAQEHIDNTNAGFSDAQSRLQPLRDQLEQQANTLAQKYADLKSPRVPAEARTQSPEEVSQFAKTFNVSEDEARLALAKAADSNSDLMAGSDQALARTINKNGLNDNAQPLTAEATRRAQATQRAIDEQKGAPSPLELPSTEEGNHKQAILNGQAVQDMIRDKARPAVEAAQTLSDHDHALLDDLRTKSVDQLTAKAEDPVAFRDAALKAKEFNDYTYRLGVGQGQTMRYLDRYGAAELYDMSDKHTADVLEQYRQAAQTREKAGYTNERTVPDYATGEKLGLKRLNDNFAQDLAFDTERRANHISELALKNGLEKAYPGQVAFGDIPRGYKALTIQHGQYISMPTELADQINQRGIPPKVNNPILKGYDYANREMKYYGLGGGTFHAGATAGTVAGQQLIDSIQHPTTIPGKIVDNLRLISGTLSSDAHDAHMEAFSSNGDGHADGMSTIDRARLSGVTLKADQILADADGQSFNLDAIKDSKFNFIKQVHDMVFQRQIPEAKLMIFEQRTQGLDAANPEDLVKMREVASAVNNLGGVNRAVEGLTPKAAQQWGRLVLATDYTEVKYRKVLDSLRQPPGNPQGDIARQMVVGKMIVMAMPGMISAGAAGLLKTPEDVLKEFISQIPDPHIITPFKDAEGRSKIAKLPGTEVSELTRIFKPMFDGTVDKNGNPDPLSGVKHYGTARLAKAPATLWSLFTNKDYYGNDVIARHDDGSINLLKTAGNVLGNATPIPISQGIKTAQGGQSVGEAVVNTLGGRVVLNPDDPQVKQTTEHFNEQQRLENLFKQGKLSQIDPSLHDVSPLEGSRLYADQYGPSHTASQKDEFGNTVPHDWNALSAQQKASYYLQNDQQNGKQSLSPTFYIDRQLALANPDRPHSALFDLQGDGEDPNHPGQTLPKSQIALDYQSSDDPSAKAVMLERNPWISDYEKTSIAESQNYKQNMTNYMQNQGWTQPAIDQYWQQHPSVTPPIQYPNIDAPVQQKLDMLGQMDDPQQRAAFIKGNPDLGVAFQQIAQYTNQMRDARGQLMLKNNPNATPEIQGLLDQLKTGNDSASRKFNAILINSHPGLQDFFADEAIHGLTNEAAKARFVGEDLDQKALKDIQSVGKYDVVKNADGSYSQTAGTTANGTALASTGQVNTPGVNGSTSTLSSAADNTGIAAKKQGSGYSKHPHVRIARLHSPHIKGSPAARASATGKIRMSSGSIRLSKGNSQNYTRVAATTSKGVRIKKTNA